MESKNSFLIYTSWRSFFELLEEPELIKELLYTMFDIAEGKETAVTNNRVKSALKAIQPKMREDLEAYEARCEKNRKAAQKRWGNPSDMHSHADAMQLDGDTDNDTDSDTDTESDNDINMSVMSGPNVPSIADVIEASHDREVKMSEEDAKEFLNYYYRDLKGQIDGKPIRNWRKLLKSWDNHTLVSPETVMGSGYDGYQNVYCRLPLEVQKAVEKDQEQFGGMLTRATARRVTELRRAV